MSWSRRALQGWTSCLVGTDRTVAPGTSRIDTMVQRQVAATPTVLHMPNPFAMLRCMQQVDRLRRRGVHELAEDAVLAAGF